MKHTVGISELKLSKDVEDVFVTYSLGSCLGISIYDPVIKIGGLIHCMLPLSKTDPEKAKASPAMFVDTGLSYFLQEIFKMGAKRQRLIVKLAGGANILDGKGLFKIGERNHSVARKILWKNDILIDSEAVGGDIPRTMFLYINDGKTIIKTGRNETVL